MHCPKCQRLLDDDEDELYVCCADAAVRWHCTRCRKVSEGFAFPYGRCPHCDGELETLDDKPVDEAAAFVAVRKAFEIELGGQAFYRRAARETDEPVLRELFSGLADMESGHMETLARRYHTPVPDVRGGVDIDAAAVFGGVVSRPTDPTNLFRIAIALENRAAEYFSECASWAHEGTAEERLYRELAAEENDHAELLASEYERWRADKPELPETL